MRSLIAGIVAGVVVFAWGVLSHIVLPLGSAGLQSLPDEERIVGSMRQGIQQPGLYFFPGIADLKNMDKARQDQETKDWEEKMRRGPSGILVISTAGREPLSFGQMASELLTNILGGVLAAILLGMASVAGFGARVFFVTVLGLFATLAIDVSHWIWYGFPTAFTLAAMLDQVVSWFLAGLVLARLVPPR